MNPGFVHLTRLKQYNMAIDINEIIQQMLEAIKTEVKKDWGPIKKTASGFLQSKKDRLSFLTNLRLQNQISAEDFKQRLKHEELILETELHALALISKVTAQNAANAAIAVLSKAVSTSIGIVL
jgi:hypothetical protein